MFLLDRQPWENDSISTIRHRGVKNTYTTVRRRKYASIKTAPLKETNPKKMADFVFRILCTDISIELGAPRNKTFNTISHVMEFFISKNEKLGLLNCA
jgi:hypothetical protein